MLHACDAINEIFPFWIFLSRGHFQNGWKSNRILVGELFPSNFRFLRSKKTPISLILSENVFPVTQG